VQRLRPTCATPAAVQKPNSEVCTSATPLECMLNLDR
jgi:hypothetical protein